MTEPVGKPIPLKVYPLRGFGPVRFPGNPEGRPDPFRPYEGDVFVFNWPHPPLPRMKPRHKPIMFDPVPDPAPTLPGGK